MSYEEDDSVEIAKLAAKIKLPKTLAGVADAMYTARQERYALQTQVKAKKAIESACTARLLEELPKQESTGIKGKIAGASIQKSIKVYVGDWDKLWKFMLTRPKDGIAFVQRRVNEDSIKRIWELKKKVPGTEPMEIRKISLTKVS